MIDTAKFTSAAKILTDAETRISRMIGVNVKLKFEIESVTSITPDNIIKMVSACSGVGVDQMTSTSRVSDVVYARFVCFFLMRKYLNMHFKEIGKFFKKDHSTVMSGIYVIENEKTNKELQGLLKRSESVFLKKLRHENTI